MLSGGHLRHRMCCWEVAQPRVGTLMVTDAVRAVDGIHPVHHVERDSSKMDTPGLGGDKQKVRQHPGPIIFVQKFGSTCQKNAQNKEKRRWAIGKPKLDNARKLRGIYFVDRDDMEFKDTMKNARKKMDAPQEFALPCESRSTSGNNLLEGAQGSNPLATHSTRKPTTFTIQTSGQRDTHASLKRPNPPESHQRDSTTRS